MKQFWDENWTELAFIIALALIVSLFVLGTPVKATAPNGCTTTGTVGSVTIALCQDEDTNLFVWANSAGMLTPADQ